jgi:tRNA pseudouridine65 synthase
LRRHLKHIFHPIVGDTRYGEGRHNRFFRERFGCHHLLLAAVEATIRHPRSGKALCLTASLPEAWQPLLSALGWEDVLEPAWRPQRKGLDAPAANV